MTDASKSEAYLAAKGLKDCLASEAGRAFLWEQLAACGVFRMSADLTAPTSSPTFFREGERNAGSRLLARIQETDIEGFLLMQREAYARTKGNDRKRERTRAAEFGHSAGTADGDGDGDAG